MMITGLHWALRFRDVLSTKAVLLVTPIAVAGSLACSVPAHAVPPIPLDPPPCANWVAYGPMTIDHSDGVMVTVPFNGQATDPTPGGAALLLADGTPAQVDKDGKPVGHGSSSAGVLGLSPDYHGDQTGRAFGGTKGNTFDLTVVWDSLKPVSSNRYTGTVDSSGHASGTDTNSGNGITTGWHIEAPFTCGG